MNTELNKESPVSSCSAPAQLFFGWMVSDQPLLHSTLNNSPVSVWLRRWSGSSAATEGTGSNPCSLCSQPVTLQSCVFAILVMIIVVFRGSRARGVIEKEWFSVILADRMDDVIAPSSARMHKKTPPSEHKTLYYYYNFFCQLLCCIYKKHL